MTLPLMFSFSHPWLVQHWFWTLNYSRFELIYDIGDFYFMKYLIIFKWFETGLYSCSYFWEIYLLIYKFPFMNKIFKKNFNYFLCNKTFDLTFKTQSYTHFFIYKYIHSFCFLKHVYVYVHSFSCVKSLRNAFIEGRFYYKIILPKIFIFFLNIKSRIQFKQNFICTMLNGFIFLRNLNLSI